ncbi:SBP2L-like protein [Mya arenaria]|uniref:SBP2L-like protein n=1 Tax=Mya arenaria TaxID=6604 RepID=A0ABY7G9C9_MYAAR|nr:SBP2L-like protein [Mya arenaria]
MVPDSSHAQQNLHYTPSQLSHNASDHPQLVSPVSAESLMTSSVCVDHMRGSEGHVTFALNSNIPVSAFSGGFHSLDASSQQYLYQNNANGSMQYFPGVSVPYTGQGDNMSNSSRNSYASVAQNGPSQIKSYINDSVAKATGDQKTCDNGNSAENSGKRVPKPGAKSRYGSVNILDIMQDLERADKEKKDGKTGSKLTKTSTSANDSKIEHTHTISSTSCSVISQTDISTTTTATTMTATTTYPDTNDDSNNVKEIHPNLMQAPPDAINFNPSVHHHQTWPYAWPNGNKEMGNLYHLQNGMKFVQNIENMPWQSLYAQQALLHNQPLHGGISFADIVKTHQPLQVQGQNQVPGQSDNNNNMEGEVKKRKRRRRRRKKKGDAVANNDAEVEDAVSEMTSAQAAKESRTSRKRRKRREVANKAAEAEMAEINLEQHMLELKMKQKLPLSARKSVSPVRNAATQGKKVCLVLPGTVAQEPAHSAPLQPSTAVKQPGILKTSSQPPVPTPSTSNTTGTTSPAPGAGGKKSKQPITYDFAAMIDASLESKKEQAKKEKEVKPVVIKKDDLKPVNQLDSSAPMVKRGKERETPKLKKPSPLKKVILKEREEKKRLRLLDDEDNQSAPVGIGNSSSYRQTDIIGLGTPNSAELSPISQPSPSCMSPLSPGTSPLSSGLTSPMTGSIQHTVKLKIHSRRFREYCNQVLDKEIDNSVIALLQDLAKAKRRFVLGLREVTKHLKLKKIKCVIISPNLEKIQSKGGLDDALNNILELCNDQSVPFIFGLGRRALGRACAKLVPVSVVGVFNYEGSEENYKSLIGLTERAREQYREMIHQIEKEVAEHPPRATTPGVPHIFAHMGHSRTPSGCSVISFTSSILSEPISENYPHSEPETDNRGYEIEKDVDELEDEMSNLQTDDAYEADDEEGFVRKKKKFVPRNIENPTKLQNGHAHSDDDDNDSELSDGQRVRLSNLESASGKVIRRPSILKNSAEWLKNRGKDFIDNNVNITNGTDEEFQSLPQNGDLVSSQQNHIMDNTNILKKQDLIKDHIHVKTSEYGAMIPSTKSFHNVDEKLVVVSNGDIVSSDSSANFQTCNEDSDFDRENKDTVSRLPTKFMDSVHHGDFVSETLSTLSQYSATTGEFDVMSTHSTTHSSQTIGEGTPHCSNINEKGERSSVSDLIDKKSIDLISQGGSNASMNSGMILKGKVKVDKENRTLSWVKEAQTLHFSEQAEQPRENEDGLSVSAGLECVDAVV